MCDLQLTGGQVMHRYFYFIAIISLCSIFSVTTWAADDYKTWNSPRDYEPIIMKGGDFPAYMGQPVSQIFAFSYNQTNDQWSQIPLQIDECDDSSHFWISDPNNVLDENDELVFMARDMGNIAENVTNWIDDAESKNYVRFEICTADPTEANTMRYLYLYLSSTLTDEATGYMQFDENLAEDLKYTINGVSYIEKHNESGLPQFWAITDAVDGNNVNILDRQKVRVSATILTFVDFGITEDDLNDSAVIEHRTGKVRIASRVQFEGDYYESPAHISFQNYYYPYSITHHNAEDIFSDEGIRVSLLRQSFDLNNSANGMIFHNNENRNIPIDGSPTPDDTMNTDIVFTPNLNWQMATGTPGTVLIFTELQSMGTSSLYFYDDNSSGGTGDTTVETGDGQSWGDSGILIKGNVLDDLFGFDYTSYFIAPQQQPDAAMNYAGKMKNPLSVSVTHSAVPVELTTFEAFIDKNNVLLKWTTATESNNFGFEVQRRKSGASEWQILNFVKGHGTTANPCSYSYLDENLEPGNYAYRLKQIDFNGQFELSQELEISLNAPAYFSLQQNYPNPFNPVTKINYQIPGDPGKRIAVSLDIYNLLGEKVKSLVSQTQSAGYHSIYWNGMDDNGNVVPTGIYVYRLQAGRYIATKRMVLMK
ncbi:T9SS type A sorting domain-containing protein [candidate division KSB1 bacterium]|nr:T9SS type A sorting domain-containing protein [candidate division KSB1 bacterium]